MTNLDDPMMETISIFRLLGQTVLLLAFISFLIQWLVPRFRKLWYRYTTTSETNIDNDNTESIIQKKLESEKIRNKQQDIHCEKAASYSERILKPREEEKIKQREKQLHRFSGPAWKGEGQKLGGTEDSFDNYEVDDVSPAEHAARRRHLPEQKIKPKTSQAQKLAEPKQKKIIILPVEPDDNDTNTVLVRLRTPIRSNCQRRFLLSNTVQDLLDYMTTVGYSQTYYTLSTTYPRSTLTDLVTSTLQDLQFIKQVTLNIEEKD